MALASLGEMYVRIGADTDDLDKGLKDSEGHIKSFGEKAKVAGKAIGIAMAAAGASLTLLTGSSMKTNAALGTTALQLGITTAEMRGLALETSNVTFPLSEVTSTFDLLTRAGMTNADQMGVTATVFDTLGDAIGMSASEITTYMIPAFNAFGIPLVDAGDHVDALTHLMRNTTITMGDFATGFKQVAPFIDELGLSMTDYIGILEAMSAKGIEGTVATRMLRSAVSGADGDIEHVYKTVGVAADEVAHYTGEVEGATGMTQEFADAQNAQFSTMDKIKHAVSELTLQYGSFLQPIEALGPIMMGLGPILLLASTANWAHAASAWAMIAPYLVIIAPIAAVVAALVILEAKFGFVTKAVNLLAGVLGPLVSGIGGYLGITNDAVTVTEALARSMETEARLAGEAEAAAKNLADAQTHVADSAKEVDVLTQAYDDLKQSMDDALGLTEDIDDQGRAIEHATFRLSDAEIAYAEAVAEHGVNSDEAARADLGLRDAVDRLEGAEQKLIKTEADLAAANTKATTIMKENGVRSLKELGANVVSAQKINEYADKEEIMAQEHTDAKKVKAAAATNTTLMLQAEEAARESEEKAEVHGRLLIGAFLGPLGIMADSITSYYDVFDTGGHNLMISLANGIVAGAALVTDAVNSVLGIVADYLPGSDAKIGPLSNLSASGASLMATFEKGIVRSNADPGAAFANNLPQQTQATGGPVNSNNSSSVNMGGVSLSRDYDFEALMKDINRHQAMNRTRHGGGTP